MRRIIRGVPKKILEYVIQLFSPTMDDYLYVMDLKEDYYMISPQAMERFLLPADHFYHAKKMHEQFVYTDDLPALWADMELSYKGEHDSHDMDYRWLDRQGHPVWINCRGILLRDPDGSAKYLVGCINEIGKKQKADNVSGLMGEVGLWHYAMDCAEILPDGFVMRLGIDDLGGVNPGHELRRFSFERDCQLHPESDRTGAKTIPSGIRPVYHHGSVWKEYFRCLSSL